MKILFLASLLIGLSATLAGARFYPWVDLERLPSHTSVVANGGRSEQFVIRLPADRIASHGSSDAGLRAAAFPAKPEGHAATADTAPLLVEQFKVRDQSGTVIGLAARHWTEADAATAAAWLLVVPGRGAMLLGASGEPRSVADNALAAAGWRRGESWSGNIEFVATSDTDEPARILGGEGEFDGIDGHYSETWRIAGVGASGELRGTIELDTVTFRRRAPSRSE